jgi:hypothetical protein
VEEWPRLTKMDSRLFSVFVMRSTETVIEVLSRFWFVRCVDATKTRTLQHADGPLGGQVMRHVKLLFLGILLLGCVPGSPLTVGRMSPQKLQSVTSKDLCYAYDHGQDTKPAVAQEVSRRELNCGVTLREAGIEPTGAARRVPGGFSTSVAPSVAAQIAASELAAQKYVITTSDATNGIVVASRVGTPYELVGTVSCRYNAYTGRVTHGITVTARASGTGTLVDIRSSASVVDPKIEYQSCNSNGYLERTLRSAVQSAARNGATPAVQAAPQPQSTTTAQVAPVTQSGTPLDPIAPRRPDAQQSPEAVPTETAIVSALRRIDGTNLQLLQAFCGMLGTSPGATFRIESGSILRRGQYNAAEKFWPLELRVGGMCNVSPEARAMLRVEPKRFSVTVQIRYGRDDMGDATVAITKVQP